MKDVYSYEGRFLKFIVVHKSVKINLIKKMKNINRNALKSSVGPENIDRHYALCCFHTSMNFRDHFTSNLKCEMTPSSTKFNPLCYDYFRIVTKLYFFPCDVSICLLKYLIKHVQFQKFEDVRSENERIQIHLIQVLSYILNRYEKEGQSMSWNQIILLNRDLNFCDSTSNKIGKNITM